MARHNYELLTNVFFFFFLVTVGPLSLPFFWGSCQGIKVLLTCPEGETAKPKSLFSIWGFQKLGLWISQGKDQKDSGVRKLVPKPVNCKPVCVCVYICVYPWGSQTSQGSMQGHVWLQPVSFRILDSLQALVTLICLQTFLPSGGFHVYFSHLPFPHLPAYSPLFLLWRKDFWRPNQNTLWNTDTEKAKCSNDWQKLPFNSDSF